MKGIARVIPIFAANNRPCTTSHSGNHLLSTLHTCSSRFSSSIKSVTNLLTSPPACSHHSVSYLDNCLLRKRKEQTKEVDFLPHLARKLYELPWSSSPHTASPAFHILHTKNKENIVMHQNTTPFLAITSCRTQRCSLVFVIHALAQVPGLQADTFIIYVLHSTIRDKHYQHQMFLPITVHHCLWNLVRPLMKRFSAHQHKSLSIHLRHVLTPNPILPH